MGVWRYGGMEVWEYGREIPDPYLHISILLPPHIPGRL
jgi:hypothetical protein